MTSGDFQKEFGTEFARLLRKPVMRALMTVLRFESPLEKLPETTSGDLVVGGNILAAECKGWMSAVHFIESLSEKKQDEEIPEADYKSLE